MKEFRIFLLLFLIFNFLFLLGGGAILQAKTKIVLWHRADYETRTEIRKLIEFFQFTHPEIEVEEDVVSPTLLDELLSEDKVPKLLPNLLFVEKTDWIVNLVDKNLILQLDEFITKEEREDIYPSLFESATYKGKIYGFPIFALTSILTYNESVFKNLNLSVPKSWEELLEIGKKLVVETSIGGKFDRWGFMTSGKNELFLSLFWDKGGTLFNEDYTKATFNSKEGVEALEYLVELRWGDKIMPPDMPWEGIDFEKVPLRIINTDSRIITERKDSYITYATTPNSSNSNLVETYLMAIFKSNPQQEKASLELIKWITSKEVYTQLAIAMRLPPIRRSISKVPDYQKSFGNNFASTIDKQLDKSKCLPIIAKLVDLNGAIDRAINYALYLTKTPKQALDDAVNEINENLVFYNARKEKGKIKLNPSPFGINAHVPTDKEYKIMADANIKWARIDFLNWGFVQPEEGDFKWELADKKIKEAKESQIQILGILSYTAPWASTADPRITERRDVFMPKLDLYEKYCFETVKRYKDYVKVWEIWNEPNISAFWLPSPNVKEYFKLLKVGYMGVKRADPQAIVIGGVTSGTDVGFFEK